MPDRPTRAARRLGQVTLVLVGTACASASTGVAGPYQVGARTDAPPSLPPASASIIPQAASTTSGPPSMGPGQPGIVGTPSARVNVSAKGDDVADVITRVAKQVGLTAVIDPAVRGPVTRSLQNMTLNDAMQSLVGSNYQYQVRNGTLVVSPVQLVQHTYTVDYLLMSRVSTASTVVARGTQGTTPNSNNAIVSGATGTGTGVTSSAGGLVASGADVIQSSSSVDVWGDLTQQLESILFGNTADSARTVTSATGALGGARGYTRCSSGTCLRISPLTSLVDVTASPEKQEEVARYIGLFSAAIGRQVSIKAQVVEVGLDRSHTFGIDWSAVLSTARGTIAASSLALDPTAGITSNGNVSFNLGIGNFTLTAVLNALQSVGDVTVVATPSTSALNQQKASFSVTRQQQFFTITRTPVVSATGAVTTLESTTLQTATVGLVFDVIPQISHDNVVMMAIRPSVTSLVAKEEIAGSNGSIQGTFPVIDHRETDTMARVRSGETIMIGGLIQKQTSNTRSGIPLLMDLPLIGRLFSRTVVSERTSELVIFLTPEIVSGQPPSGR